MKRNYINPEIEIIEADHVDVICESGGQIGSGLAKGCNNFNIDDFDDTDDWSNTEDNDFQKSFFEEED